MVAVGVAVVAVAGAVVYEAQKGMAEGAFRLSARRQLSAAQARLASSGAGVCEGVVDAEAGERIRERVRRVRRVRRVEAILEGLLELGLWEG